MILKFIPEEDEVIIDKNLFSTLVYNTSMYYTMRIHNSESRRIAMYHLEEYRRVDWEIGHIYDKYHVEHESKHEFEMLRRIIDEKFPLENEPVDPSDDDSDVPF